MGIIKTALLAAFGVAASGSCAAETVWESYPPFMSAGISGIVIGDFDGDGRADALVSGLSYTNAYSGGLLGRLAADSEGVLSVQNVYALPSGTFSGRLKLLPREGQADRLVGVVAPSDWSGAANAIVAIGGMPLRILRTWPAPNIAKVVSVADVDADGELEIVALARNMGGGYMYVPVVLDYATGTEKWRGTFSVVDMEVAQLDADPALELILAGQSGRIVDGATHETEWSWPAGFGSELLVGRFVADQSVPTFAARSDYTMQVFRGQPFTPIGEIQSSYQSRSPSVVRFEGVDRVAFNVGNAVVIRDAVSGATLFTDDTMPSYYINAAAVADIDGDGRPELIHGSSSSPTAGGLRALDMGTRLIDFMAVEESGPHSALVSGDLSGTGVLEVAYATGASGNRGDSSLYIVDAATGARSRQRLGTGTGYTTASPRLGIAQMDADPQLELVLSGGEFYRPFVAVIDGATLQDQWRRADFDTSAEIEAQSIVDANGDGVPDIAIGTSDGRISVLDGRNGQTLWQSVTIAGGSPWSIDVLAEPRKIVATRGRGIYVFNLATGFVESVAKTEWNVAGVTRWGQGGECRIGALDQWSTIRVYTCSLAFLQGWALPPETTFFRPLDANGDRFATISGNILHDARKGQLAAATSGHLGANAGFGNAGQLIVLPDGHHDVVVGSMHMVTRVRMQVDTLFASGFE